MNINNHIKIIIIIIGIIVAPFCYAEKFWVPGWQTTSMMTTPRAGAAIIEVNGIAYAMGGIDGIRFMESVEYSKFNPDGTLSTWRTTSSLNEARGFFAAVAYDGFIYVAGGGNGPSGNNYLRSIERAKIQADGSLGPWIKETHELSYPRRCVKLFMAGNTLYALGGFSGTLLDSVEAAKIDANGKPGQWILQSNSLTMPRYISAVSKVHDKMYVLGGHNQLEGTGLMEVEFTRIDKPNKLLPWRRTLSFNNPRYALSAANHKNYMYVLGGLNGAIYTDVIEKTRINSNGELQGWEMSSPLSSQRANFSSLVYKDNIYIFGGTNRDGYFATVEYAGFDNEGDIGFWADEGQARDHFKNQNTRTFRSPDLPNQGTIREIIHTSAYSYIRVTKTNDRWLAAPKSELQVNDRIRYSKGLTMHDFHSNALDRDFAIIVFIEHVIKTE